jgi:hypothetical protein
LLEFVRNGEKAMDIEIKVENYLKESVGPGATPKARKRLGKGALRRDLLVLK